MAKQTINLGNADKGNGDPIRTAFNKVNQNFTELYTALGLNENGLNLGSFEFTDNTITTTDSTNVIIDQAVTITSDLTVGGDILPQTANGQDLGSAAKPWRSLYVSDSTIYLGGAALKIDNEGELTLNDNRIVQQNGQYIDLNSNVNDVNVSNPQPGDTLQWGPGFWINVPNSDHKLVSGAKEVVLTGGTNPFVTFPAVATGENIIIQGAEIASANGTVAITSSGSVVINTNALTALNTWTFGDDGNLELPPGFINTNQVTGLNLRSGYDVHIITNHADVDREWVLDSYGDLTLPGGIKSEGNINIDINLADSTLRRWTFGEDGILNIPGDITSRQPTDLNLRSGYSVSIVTDWGDNDRTWLFDGGSGELVLPGGNVLIDPTDDNFEVRGAENVNFEANAVVNVYTDDGNHQWQFGDDGVLKLAADSGSLYANNATGRVSIGDYLGPNGAPAAPSKTLHIGGPDYVAQINGYAASNPPIWTFGNDRSLEIPGDIRSENAINIDINLSDSTLRRWTFGEDGVLNIPGGIKTSGFTIDLSTYRGVDDAGLGDYTITIDGNNIRSDKDSIGLQTVNGYGIVVDESSKNVLLGDLSSGVEINLLFGSESITGENWDAQLKMPNVGGPGVPSSFSITTQGDTNVWTFGGDGNLTFPDSTTQSTAFTSTPTVNTLTVSNGSAGYEYQLFVNDTNGRLLFRNYNNRQGVAGYDYSAYTSGIVVDTTTDGYTVVSGEHSGSSTETSFTFDFRKLANGTEAQRKGVLRFDSGIDNGPSLSTSVKMKFFPTDNAESNGTYYSFETTGLRFPDATVQTTAFTTSPTLNVLKIDDGVHEKFQPKSNATGTVAHDCSAGHIFFHTSPDANWTANFTNLNLSSGYATTVTLIIEQGGTGYYPDAVQIGGNGVGILWQGNATPTPSTNRIDVVTFSILYDGLYTVLGQLTGF